MFNRLSDAFLAVAAKYLVPVDIPDGGSNQHEIGGLVKAGIGKHLTSHCGKVEKALFPTTYIRLEDDNEPVVEKADATWYDARHKNPNRGPEYRLYYKTNTATTSFAETDFLLVALSKDFELLVVSARQNSESEARLRTIFGIEQLALSGNFVNTHVENSRWTLPLEFVFAEALGVDLVRNDDQSLAREMASRFGYDFPKAVDFSAFARETVTGLDPTSHPDEALFRWYEQETRLFKLHERQILQNDDKFLQVVAARDNKDLDVEALVNIAKSILNRRKSRAGFAFQNHIEHVLKVHGILYTAQATTENKERPDFLFPSESAYRDLQYDGSLLRMLAAKTTLKDRWRQVLKEAARIETKHLITLDTQMTAPQLAEISDSDIQLVLPEALWPLYHNPPVMTFSGFIEEIKRLGHVVKVA